MSPLLWFCNLNLYKNQGFYIYFWLCSSDILPHYFSLCFYFQMLYFGYFFFWCWNSLHFFLFFNSMWCFFFLTPSFKVLWYLWLYLFLMNYSTFEVLWFLSLYFLLLSYSIGPCFYLFILASYLCTYQTTTNEIWKILLISFQLIPQNSFINPTLSYIICQFLCKIFLCNPPTIPQILP